MKHLRGFVLLGIGFVAVLQLAAVLYFMEDRGARLLVGMVLLVPYGWVLTRTNFFTAIQSLPVFRKRKYLKMRVQVEQMLAEVRRLNGLAVDADRGFRSREEANREMDVVEQRIVELVSNIRHHAGRVADENEAKPVPEDAKPVPEDAKPVPEDAEPVLEDA